MEKMKESRRWLSWLPKALLATLLAGALAFVGCKSDDDDDDDTRDNSGPDGVEVSVTLNETTSKLFSNSDTHNTVELIATVKNAPEATVTWESNAPSIATVKADDTDSKKATVTAEKAAKGTAIITVIVGDNLAKATCTITVSDEDFVPVSAITITNADGTAFTGVQKLAVNAELVLLAATNDGATEAVTWTSSNPNIAEVKQEDDDKKATVTAKKAGRVTITAKAASPDVKSELTIEVSKGNYGTELGSQNFEDATVEDLGATSKNHANGMTIETDSSGNHYFQFTQILDSNNKGPTGSRNAYLPLSEVPEGAPYRLVFDAAMSPSNEVASQFAVVTAKPGDDAHVSGNYLLTLTSTQIRGTDASGDFEWTLNDENKTPVTLNSDTFYTFVLSVDTKRGYATLSSIDDANGDSVLEEPVVLQTAGESLAASGFNLCLGRSVRGCMRLDSIAIYEYTNAPRVPVKSVEISYDKDAGTEIGIGSDSTLKLTATVSPWYADDKTLTWKSSDDTIAKVDFDENTGVATVTGVAAGKATITVTADNVTADLKISVTATRYPVESVTLAPITKKIGIGKTVTFKPTFVPLNATNKGLTWKSSNEAIATVDKDGVVTGVAESEEVVTITATSLDNPEAQATAKVTVVWDAEDYSYSSFDFTAADNAVLTADGKELAVAQTVEVVLSIDDNALTMTNTNSQNRNNRRYGYTKGMTLPEGNFVIEFDAVLAATTLEGKHLEFCITTSETTAKKNLASEDSKNSGTYSGYSLADNNVLFLIQQKTNTDVWVLKKYDDEDDDEDDDVGPWNNSDVTADIARSSWNHYKIIYNRDTAKATVAITDTNGTSLLKRGEESIENAEITTSGISGTSAFMAGLMMSNGNTTTKLDNIVVKSAE